jgi:1-deoxy-D-xylulose-5-phosphate synthase
MDGVELRNLLYTAQLEKNSKPFSIRYPRGTSAIVDWEKPFEEIEIGRARIISEGNDIAVLSIGHPGNDVAAVAKKLEQEEINVMHYDMRFAAPLDTDVLHSVFKKFKKIITVEDGVLKGGFGSAVIEFMCDNVYVADVKRLGIHDYFVEHGSQEELLRECGYDQTGIEKAIREMISPPSPLKGG